MSARPRRRTARPAIVAAPALSLVLFLLPLALSAAETDANTATGAEGSGQALYVKYCAQCHGENGDGVGPASDRVKPAPRDFTSGKYKFRTTPSGKVPTDEDLKRVIRNGLPYTSMPAWPRFSERQLDSLVEVIKGFSGNFQNPDLIAEPIDIPSPTSSSEESIERGRQVYQDQGCASCHGDLGRGNGTSAPTLRDDWGHLIRPADLTQRFTFRGGPTKRDIFRTFSTGLNGTPMPSYADSLPVEDRWHLINYIVSLGGEDDAGYDSLLVLKHVEEELELARGEELFAEAAAARFPLIGQITEPGRNFYPSATSVEVKAVYNRVEVAFMVRWHDMRAERSGVNGPALPVPLWDDQEHPVPQPAGAGGGTTDDPFADFGAAPAASDDPFADVSGSAAVAGGEGTVAPMHDEFSDAIAIQLPATQPADIRKPYFLFGDEQSPIDLWFVDLAQDLAQETVQSHTVQTYRARGSAAIASTDTEQVETVASYDRGEWTVLFKRQRQSRSSLSFEEGNYSPIAFSVWDGFNRERGNKRALSSWFYFYVEPSVRPSALGPALRAALVVLVLEILTILWLHRLNAKWSLLEEQGGEDGGLGVGSRRRTATT
jgi:mono/diheme cytochrome c family protein